MANAALTSPAPSAPTTKMASRMAGPARPTHRRVRAGRGWWSYPQLRVQEAVGDVDSGVHEDHHHGREDDDTEDGIDVTALGGGDQIRPQPGDAEDLLDDHRATDQ